MAKKSKKVDTKYRARAGSRISQRDAAVVGKELEKLLRVGGGEITAPLVLKAARHESSPLHRFFDWDDARAAHEHRLHQARNLIASVEVIRVDTRGKDVRVRAIQHVKGNGYMKTDDIMRSRDHSASLLARFKAEADSLYRRWESHRGLLAVGAVLGAIERAGIVKREPEPARSRKAA